MLVGSVRLCVGFDSTPLGTVLWSDSVVRTAADPAAEAAGGWVWSQECELGLLLS